MTPGRTGEILVAVASVVLTAATAAAIRPADAPAGLLLCVAVACGALAYACEVATAAGSPSSLSPRSAATFTIVVRLGAESDAVARTTIVVAAAAGPTIVLATHDRPLLRELADSMDIKIRVAASLEAALAAVVSSITTDAVLMVSASAFTVADACANASALLVGDVGWVVGRVSSFNVDRYAPAERDELRSRARTRVRRAGADVWEPDATILRTDLLRVQPLEEGKPLGRWLRAQRRVGYRGVETSDVFARRAAPADAPSFWPSEFMRQRAAAVDLADAARVGPIRARLAAAGALGRELFGYPLAMWLVVPLIIAASGRFPLRYPPVAYVTFVGVVAAARWATTRKGYGIGLHPLREARAAAYDAPGSLLALRSVCAARVRSSRFRIPEQPLLVGAVLLTLCTTLVIVDGGIDSTGVVHIAAALAVIELVALWALAVRAVGKRAWERASFRVPVNFAVRIGDTSAKAINGSALGVAVVGNLPELVPEAPISISVPRTGQPELLLQGVVRNVRRTRAEHVVGIEFCSDATTLAHWIIELFSSETTETHRVRAPRTYADRLVSLEIAAVAVVAMLAFALLTMLGLGYRPLIVRSASMVPTLRVGDVVIVEPAHVAQLHPGDIITLPDGKGQLLTHRVRTVSRSGNTIDIETRGDANRQSEYFQRDPRTLVRRISFDLPAIGRVIIALGSPLARWLLGVIGAALIVLTIATSLPSRIRRASSAPTP